jgi:glutamate synthase domain-containing protein 1
MLLADQMTAFYTDLCDPDLASALALVHQRYSTNTFPSWDLAQPFRYLCHNGEINTVRGNINWMRSREPLFRDGAFGDDMADLLPVATPGGSDSGTLDNALELLLHTGRPLAQCMMMLIPEAWQHHETMSRPKKIFTPTTPASWSPGTARRRLPSPTASAWVPCWTETACGPAATR